MTVNTDSIDLKRWVISLLSIEAQEWEETLIEKGLLSITLTSREKQELIEKSVACGMRIFEKEVQGKPGSLSIDSKTSESMDVENRKLEGEDGLKSPGHLPTPEHVAESLGLTIEKVTGEINPMFPYFGLFHPKDSTIEVHQTAIENVQNLIDQNGLSDLLCDFSLYDLIVAHELFHVFEARESSAFYTKQATVTRPFLKLWLQRIPIRQSSEVAAVFFSKKWLKLTFCPILLEFLLIYSFDPARAIKQWIHPPIHE